MTMYGSVCVGRDQRPKEPFPSEAAAKRALRRKRRFRGRRFPRIYKCPGGHFHITSAEADAGR